jgi:hypothetical protein
MAAHVLRLGRDGVEPAARTALPAMNRVLYLLEGALTVDGRALAVESAWYGAGVCATVGRGRRRRRAALRAGEQGREDTGQAAAGARHRAGPGRRLSHAVRSCRVELGAEALPHRHRGGGIRYLVHGTLELRIEGERDRVIKAGEAGFESGREPVYARASSTTPTSFIRCSILPLRTSIMYVDPRDAGSKPRKYTVIIDQPIELPR